MPGWRYKKWQEIDKSRSKIKYKAQSKKKAEEERKKRKKKKKKPPV